MLWGAKGGAEWVPPPYSPLTHAVYVLGMNKLMNFTTGERSPGELCLIREPVVAGAHYEFVIPYTDGELS